MVSKWNGKRKEWSPARDLFEKYQVTEVKKTDHGYTRIEVKGPKQTFYLMSCVKPLTIIAPPENDGEPARKTEVPLFFVSGMTSSGKIQGAEFFAEINGELVAYRTVRGNSVEPL